MLQSNRLVWVLCGVAVGALGVGFYFAQPRPAQAANDRYEDYIMCTGQVLAGPRALTDGVWLLDYRSGKLLGTVIDRTNGKVLGWAEVDLTTEFSLAPRQNVHFLMTTGNISHAQSALYVAETMSGKFGVYSMGPRTDGQAGVAIRRHDLSVFRQPTTAQ